MKRVLKEETKKLFKGWEIIELTKEEANATDVDFLKGKRFMVVDTMNRASTPEQALDTIEEKRREAIAKGAISSDFYDFVESAEKDWGWDRVEVLRYLFYAIGDMFFDMGRDYEKKRK